MTLNEVQRDAHAPCRQALADANYLARNWRIIAALGWACVLLDRVWGW